MGYVFAGLGGAGFGKYMSESLQSLLENMSKVV